MPRRTKQEAEATRESILNAALDVIYEKGYARSTFVDIAKKIKLSKGAVYWHFKNKPDMFLALGRQMENNIENRLQSMFDKTYTLNDLKRILLKMILLIAEDDRLRKYYRIVFYRMEWTEELLPIKEFFDNQDVLMLDWIMEIFDHAQTKNEILPEKNTHNIARALDAFVDGLIAYCITDIDNAKENVSQIVQTGLDTFFTGLQLRDESTRKASIQ